MLRTLYYWLPPIIWAGIIFVASSQPYEQQDLRPTLTHNINLQFIEDQFSETVIYYAGTEISIDTRGVEGFVEFFIRKGAHFSVYFILGFLLYRLINRYRNMVRFRFLLSLVAVVLYAASDEIHQYFTPNRTALLEDVMLDSFGGFIGIIVAVCIYKIRDRRLK
jgi:VanZ family protein